MTKISIERISTENISYFNRQLDAIKQKGKIRVISAVIALESESKSKAKAKAKTKPTPAQKQQERNQQFVRAYNELVASLEKPKTNKRRVPVGKYGQTTLVSR